MSAQPRHQGPCIHLYLCYQNNLGGDPYKGQSTGGQPAPVVCCVTLYLTGQLRRVTAPSLDTAGALLDGGAHIAIGHVKYRIVGFNDTKNCEKRFPKLWNRKPPLSFHIGGRYSSVGIATRYGLDGPGIESRLGEARFSAPVQTGPGVHSVSCTMGTGSFPGVKRPKRDADYAPHLSAEFLKG